MASEMVERVARAIWEGLNKGVPGAYLTFDDLPVIQWGMLMATSRAAIAAMREPTEAMETEGQEPFGEYWDDANALKVWQAMIDEALK